MCKWSDFVYSTRVSFQEMFLNLYSVFLCIYSACPKDIYMESSWVLSFIIRILQLVFDLHQHVKYYIYLVRNAFDRLCYQSLFNIANQSQLFLQILGFTHYYLDLDVFCTSFGVYRSHNFLTYSSSGDI